jgi:predicted DNA-binding antitoxin AbrB/MazE fold protein
MGQTVRAVYERGQLRLLDKVTLSEGQEVSVTITLDRDRLRVALGDLVMKYPEPQSDDDDR